MAFDGWQHHPDTCSCHEHDVLDGSNLACLLGLCHELQSRWRILLNSMITSVSFNTSNAVYTDVCSVVGLFESCSAQPAHDVSHLPVGRWLQESQSTEQLHQQQDDALSSFAHC